MTVNRTLQCPPRNYVFPPRLRFSPRFSLHFPAATPIDQVLDTRLTIKRTNGNVKR